MPDDEHGTTATLRQIAPGLAWLPRVLRQNFTVAGAWSIALLIFGAGVSWAYIAIRLTHMEEALAEQRAEVKQLEAIEGKLGSIETKLDDLKEQVGRQQAKWDKVEEVAAMPRRRRR